MKRRGDGSTSNSWWPAHYKPQQLAAAIRSSREALGRPIDLWLMHHTDSFDTSPPAAFKTAMRTVKGLVEEGVVLSVGLCNCSTAHATLANEIVDLAVVQNRYNLWDRAAERPCKRKSKTVAKSNKNDVLPLCDQLGVAFMPHGALGGHPAREARVDLATDFPELAAIASRKKCSPQVLVLSWMRHKWPSTLVALVGVRTVEHARELGQVPLLRLTKAEFDTIDALVAKKTN